jgi:hypothetical protein
MPKGGRGPRPSLCMPLLLETRFASSPHPASTHALPAMEQQNWTAYSADAPVASRQRFTTHDMAAPQHAPRDATAPAQIKQEGYASPTVPSRQSTRSSFNDGDGDVSMEDADAYKAKMARPSQQHRHSQQLLQHEESAAARRYSPMNLSPTTPYPAGAQPSGQAYTSFTPQAQAQTHSNRQSPTRNNPYMSPPTSYYSPPCMSRLTKWCLLALLPADHPTRSHPTACAAAAAHPVQHEPRQLLPAERDGAAERRLQPRDALAADVDQSEPPTDAAHRRRTRAQV